MPKIGILLIAVLVLLGTKHTALFANAESEGLETLSWPQTPRPAIDIKFFFENIDGYEEERALLKCSNFDLQLSDLSGWERGRKGASRRFSAYFQVIDYSAVVFGLAEFSNEEFLTSLSNQKWTAYLNYLRTRSQRTEITFEHNSLDGSHPPFILNAHSRQVEYVYSTGSGSKRKTREIFAFIKGKLYAFVFSGPEGEINRLRSTHDLILTRMNLIVHEK